MQPNPQDTALMSKLSHFFVTGKNFRYSGRNLIEAVNNFNLFKVTVAFHLEPSYKANQIPVFHIKCNTQAEMGYDRRSNKQLFILYKPLNQNNNEILFTKRQYLYKFDQMTFGHLAFNENVY